MSHTTSPGLTRLSHWAGIAATIVEYLESLKRGAPIKSRPPIGAFKAVAELLSHMMAGIIFQDTHKLTEGVRLAAATSSLVIGLQVEEVLCGQEPTLADLKGRVEKYKRLLHRLIAGEAPKPSDWENDWRPLFKFIEVLMKEGAADMDRERDEDDGDDE